jgi:hypothetical protein
MRLEERLRAYRKRFEATVPEGALEIMHRATEDLRRSGMVERAAKVGDLAPDFSLRNPYGKGVRLADLLACGPVVLNFYRGKW